MLNVIMSMIMKCITSGILFFCLAVTSFSQSFMVAKDAYVRGGSYENDNFGADTFLIVKQHPSDPSYNRKFYLEFDLSGQQVENILSAKVKLYCVYVAAAFSVSVYRVDSAWQENTITWKNAPGEGQELASLVMDLSITDQWVEWDITEYVVEKMSGDGLISLCFKDPVTANNHIRLNSKETIDNHPVLVFKTVTTAPAGPDSLKAQVVSPKQVNLSWSDNADNEQGYILERASNDSAYRQIMKLPANSVSFSDTGLIPISDYKYRITAYNIIGNAEYSNEVSAATFNYITPLNYYFDTDSGDDRNDGQSPQTAWKSLTMAGSVYFLPGSHIYLKSGSEWTGTLTLKSSGSAENPNVIDQYGEGNMPVIHGPGTFQSNALEIINAGYWEINNIEITNFENVPAGQLGVYKRGVYVLAADCGPLRHLYFYNLKIHDVNGMVNLNQEPGENSRFYGGLFLEITGENLPTWFDDVLIEECHVYHTGRTGISNQSSWWRRSLTSAFGDSIGYTGTSVVFDNWIPSRNMIIRNNRIEHIDGNGIIIRVASNPIIEGNFLKYCGKTISGNAAFCFNTDSTFFQYNEACFTVYNSGDTDAAGIDSDYRTKNTIIQYNYLHHNGYGGLVATGGSGTDTDIPRFNDGTIIRYNIVVENEDHIIRTSGKLTNMNVYNNFFYTGEEIEDLVIIWNKSWGGAYANGSFYYNNIFYHLGKNPMFQFENSLNNVFSHNAFFGEHAVNEPDDQFKITINPDVVNPVPGEDIKSLDGFQLSPGSLLIGKGIFLPGFPAQDFYGNQINPESIDIGVHQTLHSGVDFIRTKWKTDLVVYPNPAQDMLYIVSLNSNQTISGYSFYDLNGKELIGANLLTGNGMGLSVNLSLKEFGLSRGIYIFRVELLQNSSNNYFKIVIN